MALTDEEFGALLTQARLHLNPADRPRLKQDVTSVLDHMDALNQVPTEGVEPLAHPLGLTLPLRPDTVHAPAAHGLEGSRHVLDGQVRVPRVLE